MRTLKQLQSVYKSSTETSEAIKKAIKDYGDSMSAMMIIGRNSYNLGDRVAIETRREGVSAVEIYPGLNLRKNIFMNVVVVSGAE